MEAKVFEHETMEKHPSYVRLMRVVTVPILNAIPAKFLQRVIRKTSSYAKKVIEQPGSTHSLEAMYTKEKKAKAADTFWHNIVSQPKAIRNRLKIVEMVLENEIAERKKKSNALQIYNIGGGSSRAIIQVVSRELTESNLQIRVTTVDRDKKALELGRKIALDHNIEGLFTWIEGDARNLENLVDANNADVVEMVGLLDYFDFDGSIQLIKQIRNCLKPGGLFIVANVHPNSESKFVENVGWPKMFYKTAEEMGRILSAAGFKEEEVTLHFEPLMVHLVGVARKT
ncbi:MAG: methyltransferase domain-containing protein [Candidatus Doudnabacteria bacterium]|nr:methyltransferase domain-containing protein [Candidatus Doudnabacteria bacterium]